MKKLYILSAIIALLTFSNASKVQGACSITVTVLPTTVTINLGSSTGTITATPHNNAGVVSYAWAPCSTLNSSTGASVIATPTASTTYTVTAFDANGCTATATVTVNVTDPAIPSTASTTVSGGYVGSNVTNTFADITPATTLQTGNTTNANYAMNNIGFTFNFNGTSYTQFGLNTNGYIWFQHDGLGAPLATTTNPLSNASANLGGTGVIDGIISVMGTFINADYDQPAVGNGLPNGDYSIGTPSIGYTLTGSAPNRILTIQWAGYSPADQSGCCVSAGDVNDNRVDFQIILNENGGAKSNQIQMNYSNEGPECIDVGWSAEIGLRGTSNTDFNDRSATKGAWATSTAGGTNAVVCSTTGSCFSGTWVKSPSFLFTPTCSASQTTITPSGTTNLCPGGSVTLTASAGSTYQWYLNETLTDTTTQSISGITTAGNYVAVSSSGGCGIPSYVIAVTTNATVTPSVSIVSNPSPSCGNATFTATPVNPGCVPIYNWLLNGTAVSGVPLNSTTYTNNALSANDQVQVVMTSGALCSSPATASSNIITDSLPVVAPIAGGASTACLNTATPAFTDATSGGSWSITSGTGTASITAGGVVTGLTSGTVTVVYTYSSVSCTNAATAALTVNALPTVAAITGTESVCVNSTTQLSDATAGGTWSSGTPSVATINSSSGLVTAITGDTSVITYTVSSGGCSNAATATVTVNALPTVAAITGTESVCVNSTTQLSDATTGGTWSSGTPSVATINSSSGLVTGVAADTSVITYTTAANGGGCVNTTTATVTVTTLLAVAAITGTESVCVNSTTQLSDATTGGTWSSGTPSVATIDPSSGLVTGIAGDTSVITYSVSSNGCSNTVTATVTVNALPVVAAITGNENVCLNSTSQLNDATAGGTWSSGTTSVATINSSSGLVTGVASDTSVITYTVGSNGCVNTTTATVTVNALPTVAAITGTDSVCINATTQFSDLTTGGSWSSGTSAIATVNSSSGAVTGVSGGNSIITYTTAPNGNGCTSSFSTTVNVKQLPTPGAFSSSPVCYGKSLSLFSSGGESYAWTGPNGFTYSQQDTIIENAISNNAGTYSVTVTNASGCTATSSTTVIIYPSLSTPAIKQDGDSLISNYDPSYTYQWYADTVLIPGATDTVLVVSTSGNYNLQVTDSNGCELATGINVTIAGVSSLAASDYFVSLVPNPATTLLTIHASFLGYNEGVTLSIMNVLGEIVRAEKLKWNNEETLNIKALPAGIYLLQMKGESGNTVVKKFVKE